jgi:hypothetical protein
MGNGRWVNGNGQWVMDDGTVRCMCDAPLVHYELKLSPRRLSLVFKCASCGTDTYTVNLNRLYTSDIRNSVKLRIAGEACT